MKNDEWGGSLTGIESWFNESVVVVVFVILVVIVLFTLRVSSFSAKNQIKFPASKKDWSGRKPYWD